MKELCLPDLEAARSGDREAAGRLLEENSGLIWSVARRYFGRGTEAEDLYQLGCLGFLKAIEGFDTSFGTRFSTYAVPKIAGEIRRFLRDDGMVKVSRTVKEQAARIQMARISLEQRLGREPVLSELSEATGISAEDIAFAQLATGPTQPRERGGLQPGAGAGRYGRGGADAGAGEHPRAGGKAAGKGAEGDRPALLPRPDPAGLRQGAGGEPGADFPPGTEGRGPIAAKTVGLSSFWQEKHPLFVENKA